MRNGKRRALGACAVVAVAGAAAVALVAGGSPQDVGDEGTDRQEAVAERGKSVMPFDLEQTTHRFTPTKTGGVQDVVADRSGDEEQIRLIRAHLREEGEAFGRGDFADPARIHGTGMPGLAALEEGHDRIDVRYENRPDGATLTYVTQDPVLVDALHDWFEAQIGDHGGHAETGL